MPSGPGYFYPPTVLADTPASARLTREEVFGPVAPTSTFTDEQDMLRAAIDAPAGLVSYLYTRDTGRAIRLTESLETGMVGLNQGLVSNPAAPFGGMKQSGLGHEGGRTGMEEYLEVKYVAMGVVRRARPQVPPTRMARHAGASERRSTSAARVPVPDDALWGAQTQRALETFSVSDLRLPRQYLACLGALNCAAAHVNVGLGRLDPSVSDAIIEAAGEVADGRFDDHFPVDLFQTGSGTNTNMSANEVIANRAANQRLGVPPGIPAPGPPERSRRQSSNNGRRPSSTSRPSQRSLTG